MGGGAHNITGDAASDQALGEFAQLAAPHHRARRALPQTQLAHDSAYWYALHQQPSCTYHAQQMFLPEGIRKLHNDDD